MRRILAAMTGSDPDLSASRATMVARQLRARGIADERVLEAMGTVPREAFVPDRWRREAYADEALPIDAGQTISQPVIVARMTELLQIAPGDRILEIGTGSGYQAAILASLGAEVTSLERQRSLVEPARQRLASLGLDRNVTIREADGSLGDEAGAPWDGVVVTAAAPAIPMPLREQLADGARLVIPVGPRDQQFLTVVERRGSDWTEWTDGACVFVPLIGLGGFEPRPGDRTEPPNG
jgi:protein-L-isoaspartate(D-aspartate) O-methyltransferase